jgi:hypothetical protein
MDVKRLALMESDILLGIKWQFMRNKPCEVRTWRLIC